MGKKNKKQQFIKDAGSKKADGGKGTIVGVIVGIMIAAVVGFTMFASTEAEGGYKKVKASNGAVKIAVADVSDGAAHYYSYKSGGRVINFFILESSDGIIRAAFDACDVCFSAKKGYRQEGNEMVCNNCGQRFPSTKINEVKGGCNPSPLNRTIEGDTLVLRTTDIESGGRYF